MLPLAYFPPKSGWVYGAGWVLILTAFFLLFPAIVQFIRSHNTLITIKPANSLQTAGIYSISRNPMYLGLLLIYSGVSFLKGNAWSFLVLPLLVWIVNEFVIKREERYLTRAFGLAYQDYKQKVRRWL
jgi:protein-S-isoprenylcysteine O-methyltransferase Ste14